MKFGDSALYSIGRVSPFFTHAFGRRDAISFEELSLSRRSILRVSAASGVALAATAVEGVASTGPANVETPRKGAIGYTSFIHPAASVGTLHFQIGAQSLIEGQVQLEGASTQLGNASDLQDNCRLQSFGNFPGDLTIGDGSLTAHNVTFIGKVTVGDAVGRARCRPR